MSRLAVSRIGLFQCQYGGSSELLGEVKYVAHGGSAETVDGLRVVSDDHDVVMLCTHASEDRGLKLVGVLIFIDQQVVEASAQFTGRVRIRKQMNPVQQQIVVIQYVSFLLAADIEFE